MDITNKSSSRGWLRKLINVTMLLVGGIYGILVFTGMALGISDPVRKADAIVLLSGGGKTRSQEVIRLYNQGAADTIVLTQTLGSGSSATISETRRQLNAGGVPMYKIQTATGTATSTFDEARQVAKLAERQGFGSILVVTDPYHALRARILFTSELRDQGVTVKVTKVSDHWYKPYSWMFSREGWRVTISEMVKLGGIMIGVKGG